MNTFKEEKKITKTENICEFEKAPTSSMCITYVRERSSDAAI